MENVDVIIIGSGLAGYAAAAEAAAAGAKTVVLEKMSYTGGNSALAGGGYAAWDSKLKLRQKLELGDDSWQRHMEDTIRTGKGENLPELVEVMVKNAPAGIDWLVDLGMEYKNVLAKLGGYTAHRNFQAAVSGKRMMELVRDFAERQGAETRTGCAVTALERAPRGRVTGVRYTDAAGEHTLAARRGVVIAAGGFSRDEEMRRQYCPQLPNELLCSNHHGATGEVIRAAQAIGADVLHMNFIQLYPCANPETGSVDRCAFYCYSGAAFGMIYTDGQGQRFIDELSDRDQLSAYQLAHCEKPTWAVLNGKIVEALGMTEQEVATAIRVRRLKVGGTVAELAQAMGADAETLCATVGEHNRFLAGEMVDPWGKQANSALLPMLTGPYYAIAQWPAVHYTMGGLRIDTAARVLDGDRNPIPGLFAAGEVCGGVHGANRMGGNALAECVVFGRIAGQNAAAE